jgi:hypothetical protein
VDLQRELASRAADLRGCYERLLRRDKTREGRVVVQVIVAEDGAILGATLVEDGIDDSELSECILSWFRPGLAARPQGGCANIRVPINFAPKKPEPAPVGNASTAP